MWRLYIWGVWDCENGNSHSIWAEEYTDTVVVVRVVDNIKALVAPVPGADAIS